eukprot:scaffold78179_cov29-Tisochrysis_lutea.AAC.3
MGETGGGVGGGTKSSGVGLNVTLADSPISRTKRSVEEKMSIRRQPGLEDVRGPRPLSRSTVRVPLLDQQSRMAISSAVRIAMN